GTASLIHHLYSKESFSMPARQSRAAPRSPRWSGTSGAAASAHPSAATAGATASAIPVLEGAQALLDEFDADNQIVLVDSKITRQARGNWLVPFDIREHLFQSRLGFAEVLCLVFA